MAEPEPQDHAAYRLALDLPAKSHLTANAAEIDHCGRAISPLWRASACLEERLVMPESTSRLMGPELVTHRSTRKTVQSLPVLGKPVFQIHTCRDHSFFHPPVSFVQRRDTAHWSGQNTSLTRQSLFQHEHYHPEFTSELQNVCSMAQGDHSQGRARRSADPRFAFYGSMQLIVP